MATVAIIEDNKETNGHLKSLVESIKNVSVHQFFDRVSAEIAVQSTHFDLVVLDIELGQSPQDKYGGLQILSMLSGKKTVTIVVSGTSEESLPNIVITLQAYDFIGKPINDLAFLNKVGHALNSQEYDSDDSKLFTDVKKWPEGLSPDPDRHPGFLWKGQRLRLTLTQLRLLNCLIKTPGKPVEASRLAKQLDSSSSPAAIATHVSDIRHRFTDIDSTFSAIDLEPGKGYVWID